jgi:carboxyl-terminal processing protease
MRLDKAVRLIRGPKGTEVRLTVKKVDGTVVVIPIIRDVVVIEETYAKSLVLKEKGDSINYGYIHLGSFYAEFGKRNGKRCSVDVLKQIEALKASAVEGIILDLRSNGGGSLSDAVDMVGYFIKTGPVVQVDGAGQPAQSYKDKDPEQQFKKPLVVMVNEFSASASEIFAAAIQDYGRGVIVGSNTFGKGTVQRFFALNEIAPIGSKEEDYGAVKQTIAKFFRINGGATQLKGVLPDVELPIIYKYIDVGEKEYDYALPWTSIPSANYLKYEDRYDVQNLNKNTQLRVDTSSYFSSVKKNARVIKESSDLTKLPLGLDAYKLYKKERKKISDESKVKDVATDDIEIGFNKLDMYTAATDTILKTRLKKFKENTEKDHYVRESLRVLSEIVKK